MRHRRRRGAGRGVEFAAHLPQFGGQRGLLIDLVLEPEFEPSPMHVSAAANAAISLTFIDPASLRENADEFVAALKDWGYVGDPLDLRPELQIRLLRRPRRWP